MNALVSLEEGSTRRSFLKTSLAVAAATAGSVIGAAPAAAPGAPAPAAPGGGRPLPHNPRTAGAMPLRNLGKTGYRTGIFSLGCQATVEEKGKDDIAEAILHRAIDLGVNYFDTAPAYGAGQSETNVGRVMKTRRREVWLASKTAKFKYDDAMKSLEESLSRLQTDHLDTWQLHNVQRMEQLEQIFAKDGAIHALQKMRGLGVVRCLGLTGHFEPLVLLEGLKRFPFDSILLALNAADPHYLSFKEHLLPEAQRQGIGIIGMKVATRGRLISEWTPPPLDQQPERMRTLKKGTITMKESLTYNLSLPVSTNIVGCDHPGHVEANVRTAAEFSPLSEAQMRDLERRTLPVVRQALYFRRWDLGA